MGLERVLNRLESNENTFHTLSKQYGQDVGEYTKNEQKAKLDSISAFSQTLSEYLVEEKKEENERLEDEGKIAAIEGEIEKQEEEGDPGISTEEKIDYYAGVNLLKENKLAFDSAALETQKNGGSFQESEEVRNMSGWKLYGYTKQKAIMAGDNYKAWMEGEMANNNDIQISFGGRDFTPSNAQSLQEKSVAMGALRKHYLKERGLLGINHVLLADHFYDKAITSHGLIMADFQKQDAINRSFLNEEQAVREFRADKDFGVLVSSLAPLWDKNGNRYGYSGALSKAMEIVKDQMDIDEIDEETLNAIKAQTTTIDGKEVVVGKHWETRFKQLDEDLIKEQKENLDLQLDRQDNEGKEVEVDFHKWKKEMLKNGDEITDAHMEVWSEISYQATGDSAPSWITDFQTKEDRDDDDDIKRLKKLRKSKGYLVESDLAEVSEDVYDYMSGFVQKDKSIANAPGSYDTEAKNKIRAWGIKAVKMEEGQSDTVEFVEGYWNAYHDYQRRFRSYIRAGEPVGVAQKLALQDVQVNFNLEDDTPMVNSIYWTSNKPDVKPVAKSAKLIKDISNGISTINQYSTKQEVLTNLSETVIPGSEAYLIEGRKFKEGKVNNIDHYYERIAAPFKDLSAWDILDAQLKADGDKDGLGERPEVLNVLDDPILKDLKKKLNKSTTKNQIEQSKFDVHDIETFASGAFSSSIFNTDENLLTPGLGKSSVETKKKVVIPQKVDNKSRSEIRKELYPEGFAEAVRNDDDQLRSGKSRSQLRRELYPNWGNSPRE